jgi:hypothetical protein
MGGKFQENLVQHCIVMCEREIVLVKIIVSQQLLWIVRLAKLKFKELEIPSGQELYCFSCYSNRASWY